MNIITRRIIGLLLILAAFGGLVFSITGLALTWRIKPAAEKNLSSGVDLVSSTLATTAQGLVVTQESLEVAVESIRALQGTLDTTAKTLKSSEPMVTTVVQLMDQDLPAAVQATQASLLSAQESARVIDSLLEALNFLPGINYNPELPLNATLGDVSTSLDGLPVSFDEIGKSLTDTRKNLQSIQVDLALMVDSIRQIEKSITRAGEVVEQYQVSVETVQKQLKTMQNNIPTMTTAVAWGFSLFLGWMAIAQLGLFTQGWGLVNEGDQKKDQQPPAEEAKQAAEETEQIQEG